MDERKELVETRTGEVIPFDRGPIGIDEAKKRIKENQDNAIKILEEGVDWERISGIPKPMLKKPAAEKLSRYAGVVGLPPVQAHYEIIERDVDPFLEWEFQKKVYEKGKFVGVETIKTRGFYRYRVCCTLRVLGTEVAVGNKIGTCSSSDPGKETAMENTVLQQAQIRANRQAVMAYIGISDRFTEEEAGDEIKRRKEVVGGTDGDIPKPEREIKSKFGSEDKPARCGICKKYHICEGDTIYLHPTMKTDKGKPVWGAPQCYAATFKKADANPPSEDDGNGTEPTEHNGEEGKPLKSKNEYYTRAYAGEKAILDLATDNGELYVRYEIDLQDGRKSYLANLQGETVTEIKAASPGSVKRYIGEFLEPFYRQARKRETK